MKKTFNDSSVRDYGAKLATFWKVAALSALVASVIGFAAPAHAAVTFGASVTNANGTLSTTLNWSAPGASGCTASGHTSWTGAKAASGSLALPPITLSGSYNLTLSCTTPTVTTAIVTWAAPIANTDNTAYTNPKGFRIFYNTGGENMVDAAGGQTRDVNVPTATTYTVTGLTPGDWYFGVSAVNVSGAVSAPPATRGLDGIAAHKVITAAAVENASVTLTVNPIPKAPTNVAVE